MAKRKAPRTPLDILDLPEQAWKLAIWREKFIRPLSEVPWGAQRAAIADTARRMKANKKTVWRLLVRYRQAPSTLSLVPRRRGAPVGRNRISPEQDAIVRRVIVERWRRRTHASISEIVLEAARVCRLEGVRPVSRNTVLLRIERMQDPFLAESDRLPATPRTRATPGAFTVHRALEVVQIDHTPVDIIVVDELYRKPVGRPWLTLAIDVCTRMVMGFSLSFDPPSSISVASCLSHACLSKNAWLKEHHLELDWPTLGLPDALHMDNAPEFHAEALRRGAERYGIRLIFRPVGRPHYGGHIERCLGTFMSRLHSLPGQTGSNPKARGDYPSEKKAVFTLAELERWLAIEICEKYHHAIHRGLNCTPLSAWTRASQKRRIEEVRNPEQFAIDFMPVVERKVRRDGIKLFNIRYWDALLEPLISRDERVLIRYDPRNLSKIYVPVERLSRYLEVRYADLRHPPISLWEQRSARAHLREEERKAVDETALFRAIEVQRKLIQHASAKTRRARRVEERMRTGALISPQTKSKNKRRQQTDDSVSLADYSRDVTPSTGERWD